MRLFLFTLTDPNAPRFDVATGWVVAAESEVQARALLSAPEDPDEPDDRFNKRYAGDEGRETWADDRTSSCQLIATASIYTEPTIVLRRFNAG